MFCLMSITIIAQTVIIVEKNKKIRSFTTATQCEAKQKEMWSLERDVAEKQKQIDELRSEKK